MKSLVVDDDYTCSCIYRTLLSKYGQCDTTTNGWDAVNTYEASLNSGEPYDLLLIDIMMPDINGYDVLKNVRIIEDEKGCSSRTKIILTTGLDDEENRKIEQQLDKNTEAYLVKSNDNNDLYEKLTSLGFNLSEFV